MKHYVVWMETYLPQNTNSITGSVKASWEAVLNCFHCHYTYSDLKRNQQSVNGFIKKMKTTSYLNTISSQLTEIP